VRIIAFIGNSELDGLQNIYFSTDNKKEYLFDNSNLSDYFISIINDNNISVPIDEVMFEIRNESRYFITTWKTDNIGLTEDNQIGIPTNSNYTYNYTINWGDGYVDENVTGDINHTYASAGVYRIKIDGEFPTIFFYENYNGNDNNMNSDKRKLLSVEQWGDIKWKSMRGSFAGCQNMNFKATDTPDLSQVDDMSLTFLYAYNFSGTGMSNWDVSNITKMYGTFNGAKSFNENIENWDVSSVTNMYSMFYGATSFSNRNLSGWSVENVENHSKFSEGWGSGNIEPIWSK